MSSPSFWGEPFFSSYHTCRRSCYTLQVVDQRPSPYQLLSPRPLQRMAMVDMRSVVERHAYAPGCHPKALHAASSWREGHGRGGRGKAKGAATVTSPSLTGVFEEA